MFFSLDSQELPLLTYQRVSDSFSCACVDVVYLASIYYGVAIGRSIYVDQRVGGSFFYGRVLSAGAKSQIYLASIYHSVAMGRNIYIECWLRAKMGQIVTYAFMRIDQKWECLFTSHFVC